MWRISERRRRMSRPEAIMAAMEREKTEGVDGRRGSRGLDCRCLFGLGVPELVVIAGVVALVFGPKKLPEVGRSIGKTVKSFQQSLLLI
ncbi:hypothetical protein QJS04_geneDACA021870 [Acorus gramineus]|uniref:Sec-independent protein translocase protein TatA n=1 Tax=Acorus gramineus TaxID=55184 RepID=A0AAV9ANW3_ACOGR|nr:hypothetical protein QJS04_geneDACA021870 [Acorus gramineus]